MRPSYTRWLETNLSLKVSSQTRSSQTKQEGHWPPNPTAFFTHSHHVLQNSSPFIVSCITLWRFGNALQARSPLVA